MRLLGSSSRGYRVRGMSEMVSSRSFEDDFDWY